MKSHSIVNTFVLLAIFCSCNNQEVSPILGGGMGHIIGFSRIDIKNVEETKAGVKSYSFDEMSGNSCGIDYISTAEVFESTIKSEDTKANYTDADGVVTRDALKTTGFYVDGFLQKDKMLSTETSQKFIAKKQATYISEDIDRWQFSEEYNWRNKLWHYFWAYNNDIGLTYTGTDPTPFSRAEFTYEDNIFGKDLVLAYHEQYWDTDECMKKGIEHAGDELTMLQFNHALAEVNLSYTVKFRKYASEAKQQARDTTGSLPNVIGGKGTNKDNPRATLNSVSLLLYTKGDCIAIPAKNDVQDIEFDWSNFTASDILKLFPNFIIPQDLDNIEVHFNITDVAQKTADLILPLPTKKVATEGGSGENTLTEITAGHKYDFQYNCVFMLPYVPDGQEGMEVNFYGDPEQIAMPFDPADMTRIKTLEISWYGLPYCQSGGEGEHVVLILCNKKIEMKEEKNGNNTIVIPDPNIPGNTDRYRQAFGFPGAPIEGDDNYDPELISMRLFETNPTHEDAAILNVGQETYLTESGKEEIKITSYPVTVLKVKTNITKIKITNIDVANYNGKFYFYLGCYNGNNGQQQWTLTNLRFDVLQYGE